MTPPEAAALLAAVAANDGRNITEANAHAWAAALPDVPLADALEVLPRYYRNASRDTKNWIYPGDVLELSKELHRERLSIAGKAAYREVTGVDMTDVFDGRVSHPENHDEGWKACIAARRDHEVGNHLALSSPSRQKEEYTPW